MKIKVVMAFEDEGKKQAVVVVENLRSPKFGVAVLPAGNVLVAYETRDGAPGPEVAKALREIADSIDKGGAPVLDITPIIPEAQA